MPVGLIKNQCQNISIGLNGHNAKVYSGIEQVFVAQLTAAEKVDLIQKLYNGVYYGNEFVVNKLAFNEYTTAGGGITSLDDKNADVQKQAETLLYRTWALPINPKKSKFNVKTQGENKGKTYHSVVSVNVVGAGRISAEFFHALLNNEIAVIFKDANNNFRLLFDPTYSVEVDVEQDSGEGISSEVGFNLTFSVDSKIPPIFIYGRFEVLASVRTDEESKQKTDVKLVSVYASPRPQDFIEGDDKVIRAYTEEQCYRESGI